jgi:hypothetical protein
MGMFLDEKTPRKRTRVYVVHRFRAVVRVQFPTLVPVVTFFSYCLTTIIVYGRIAGADFLTLLSVGAAAGLPAALGAHALWCYISARLYPVLDAHPQSQEAIKTSYRLPPRPEFDEPAAVLGEYHPERRYETSGDYELEYSTSEQYSATPEWSVLPARSLVTGLLVLGSIGSGKTAYVLRPAIFNLFHHSTRPGGLVMDSKAVLVEPLRSEMIAAGRESDLLAVGPQQPTRWNPLHMPLSSPATVAAALLTAVENINGAPYNADSRWIRNGAAHLVEGVIGLLRLRTGYVTALTVRMFFGQLIEKTQGTDEPGKAVKDLLATLFSGCTAPTDKPEEYEHYSGLVTARMSEDEKFRAIYVSELLSLLVPLTSPDVVHLYNASENELDMPSWPDAINRGLVVVLDCNSRAQPALAVILGMLLKLGYQDAMLSRLAWQRAGLCDSSRYMCLLVDEYQDYSSPGDSDYLALCRESKSISVFLTQGYASIVQRVGEDRSKVILQSMRNRLVLTQTVPEHAADLLGKHEVQDVSTNISEQIQDASLHTTGRFAGQSSVSESLTVRTKEEHVIAASELQKLPTGQGILQSHDGIRHVPLHRVYLRPHFAPDTRHADLKI